MRGLVAEGCREIDYQGQRFYAGTGTQKSYETGGLFTDLPAGAARDLVAIGGVVASEAGTTRRGIGYRCPGCGFGSFTRTCGRCGAECGRE